jgi:hypothetical protein
MLFNFFSELITCISFMVLFTTAATVQPVVAALMAVKRPSNDFFLQF